MPGIGPDRAIKDSMMWSSQGILSSGIRIASEMDCKCAQPGIRIASEMDCKCAQLWGIS